MGTLASNRQGQEAASEGEPRNKRSRPGCQLERSVPDWAASRGRASKEAAQHRCVVWTEGASPVQTRPFPSSCCRVGIAPPGATLPGPRPPTQHTLLPAPRPGVNPQGHAEQRRRHLLDTVPGESCGRENLEGP